MNNNNSKNNNDFNEHFLNILQRKLIENRSSLWLSAPENEASMKARLARLVGIVDRTRVFSKLLAKDIEGTNKISQILNGNNNQFELGRREEEEKRKRNNTRNNKSDTNSSSSSSQSQLLMNFAKNNPLPVSSKQVAVEGTFGVLPPRTIIDISEQLLALNNTSNNVNNSLSSTNNTTSSSTTNTSNSNNNNNRKLHHQLMRLKNSSTGDKVSVPSSMLSKNFDLKQQFFSGDDDNEEDLRILHLNGVFQPTMTVREKKVMMGTNSSSKKTNNNKLDQDDDDDESEEDDESSNDGDDDDDEELDTDDGDGSSTNKKKKNKKNNKKKATSTKNKTTSKKSPKLQLIKTEEDQDSIVPLPGERVKMRFANGLFCLVRRRRHEKEKNRNEVDDDQDDEEEREEENHDVELVGEIPGDGELMVLFA